MANPKTLQEVCAGTELRDQHGKLIDPATLFKDGQCLVLFGYEGCGKCEDISKLVAASQKELLAQGMQVPIMVISVQPVAGRTTPKTYVASYYEQGVQQFADEKLAADRNEREKQGMAAYTATKDRPQKDRLLHIVFPPDDAASQRLEEAMGLVYNKNDREGKSHSPVITLFDHGVPVKTYRGLPPEGEDAAKYAATLAPQVAADVKGLHEKPGATPPPPGPAQDNKTLWNIGAPAVAGLAALVATGFSLEGFLAALLAAGVTSVATQYVTQSGVFEASPEPDAPVKTAKLPAPGDAPARAPDYVTARAQADAVTFPDINAVQPTAPPKTPVRTISAEMMR